MSPPDAAVVARLAGVGDFDDTTRVALARFAGTGDLTPHRPQMGLAASTTEVFHHVRLND